MGREKGCRCDAARGPGHTRGSKRRGKQGKRKRRFAPPMDDGREEPMLCGKLTAGGMARCTGAAQPRIPWQEPRKGAASRCTESAGAHGDRFTARRRKNCLLRGPRGRVRLSKKPGVDKGPQPLMFHPALTTSASERMKTQRFSYVAGFAARERMREAKPVKARKSGVPPLFRYAETSIRASFLLSAQVRAALRPVKKISATAIVGVKKE